MKGSLEVETVPAPVCPVCGSTGEILYRDLPDKLFGASGGWTFKRCVGCDGLWVDPISRELRRSYQFCHTHLDPVSPNAGSALAKILRAIYKPVKGGYLRARLKYREGVGPVWCRIFAPPAFLHPAGIDGIADDTMFLSAPSSGARLLEVGCGNGSMLEKMQERGWDVLKRDGQLVMTTPNSQSWGHKHYRQDWRGLESPRHLQIFNPRSLLRLTQERR